MASVIDHYGDDQDTIIPNAGPGHWNDPDMLIIGNFGLSYEQVRTFDKMCLRNLIRGPSIFGSMKTSVIFQRRYDSYYSY